MQYTVISLPVQSSSLIVYLLSICIKKLKVYQQKIFYRYEI